MRVTFYSGTMRLQLGICINITLANGLAGITKTITTVVTGLSVVS